MTNTTNTPLLSIAADELDRVAGGFDLSSAKINPGALQCNEDYPRGGHTHELRAASPDAFKQTQQPADPMQKYKVSNGIGAGAGPNAPRPNRPLPPRPAMR